MCWFLSIPLGKIPGIRTDSLDGLVFENKKMVVSMMDDVEILYLVNTLCALIDGTSQIINVRMRGEKGGKVTVYLLPTDYNGVVI